MPLRFERRGLLAAGLALVAIPAARAPAAQAAQDAQPAQPAQSASLDALAAKMTDAIHKTSKLPFSKSNVLVVDFVETQGPPTELGADLARQFSDSLNKHAQGFNLVDRTEYLKEFASDKLSADSYSKPETMKCYAMEFGAMAVVTGHLDDFADKVELRVQAERISDKKGIFDERISLPMTPEMQALISKRAIIGAGPSASDGQASDPGRKPRANGDAEFDVPAGGTRGYSMPSCLYCPRAEYSKAAAKAEFQGNVLLTVEIDANGTTKDGVVVKGAPCGLNEEAIEAVKRWKFKPATGPDGDPAAVSVPIEVEFHLY
jgi:TonB family protein